VCCLILSWFAGFLVLGGFAVDHRPGFEHRERRETTEGQRVAVCFYGLTRSLPWTLPSIESRVMGVLRANNFGVDVFVHTFDLKEVGTTSGTGGHNATKAVA